jgi:hypothetical protein
LERLNNVLVWAGQSLPEFDHVEWCHPTTSSGVGEDVRIRSFSATARRARFEAARRGACTGLMPGFFGASQRGRRNCLDLMSRYPGEFGADLLDEVLNGCGAWHHHADSTSVFSRISRWQFGHFAGTSRM